MGGNDFDLQSGFGEDEDGNNDRRRRLGTWKSLDSFNVSSGTFTVATLPVQHRMSLGFLDASFLFWQLLVCVERKSIEVFPSKTL